MSLTLAKWSLADYHRLVATGLLADRAVELLAGDIVEMPPEGPEHAYLSTRLDKVLSRLLGDRAEVRQGHPITLPPASEPEPDLAIMQPLGSVYRDRHPSAAEIFWLIEYANTSLSKDRDVKRKLYAQASIPAYWLVDLQNRQVYGYSEPQAGDYQQVEILAAGAIALPHFPELQITVAQLLAS
ncbi:MAG: Uma2 family endonuclease [Spirulinaceae cyanobacterium SM2_1_0]|nr:Uma2 family endonuclease [Spirulinaceae cyanobacterium SM2_1_0]